MWKNILEKLENPKRPLLGPNVKALQFWGLLLPNNFWRKKLYIFLHSMVILFSATEYIDVWYVKSDINLLLSNLKITMLATISVCKVTTFISWQKYWKSIIEYVTRADLYQRTNSDMKKMQIIHGFTKYSRKITYLYWLLTYSTGMMMMIMPIFMYFFSSVYRENLKNGTETYIQVVSSWVPFDKNTIYGYTAASFFQSYATLYATGWITSFDTNAMVIMVFFRAELELLRTDCSEIFGKETEPVEEEIAINRLKDCHRRYVELCKFARLFDSCLSPVMLLYMFVCSIMLCVTGYQINLQTTLMQRFLTCQYLVFGISQLFIYCWHSNDVLYASQNIMLGPYESTWWMRDTKYRKDLYILIAQLNKGVVFSAGPFTKLTVSTFITILKGAYSYYTLLGQSQIK